MSFTKETFTHFWSKITGLVGGVKNDVAINNSSIGMSKKNLLNNTATTKVTPEGVTFTVNNDKSITLSGTCTASTGIFLDIIYLEANTKYIINSNTSTAITFQFYEEDMTTYIENIRFSQSSEFSVTESKRYALKLCASASTTYDNITVYPMIRYADITDNTYEPYVDDLQTQIDDIKENYATKTEVDENSVGKFYTEEDGSIGEIFNDYTNNIATGEYSHAEGCKTTASGDYSHAEGDNTKAYGLVSHAEGSYTKASGICSHAEGINTTASGHYSHARGFHTIANGKYQTVMGVYNIEDTPDDNGKGKYALIIGNGTNNTTERSNCFAVDWEGNIITPKGTISMDLINSIASNVALNTSSVGMSRKNLFNIKTFTETIFHGITYKSNSDKSITASGKCDTASFTLDLGTIDLKAGNSYIIYGNGVAYKGLNNSTTTVDVTSSKTLNVTEDCTLQIFKWFGENITYNATIKCMVCYADITDSTYESYTPSLQEQINNIVARLTALEG